MFLISLSMFMLTNALAGSVPTAGLLIAARPLPGWRMARLSRRTQG
jgi:hypothetical protein